MGGGTVSAATLHFEPESQHRAADKRYTMSISRSLSHFRSEIGQVAARAAIGRSMSWSAPATLETGYTVVLGTPWDLRHLLDVNLQFVSAADTTNLQELIVVFDRCHRDEMAAIERSIQDRFQNLPLRFMHYPERPGRLVERLNISTFYNSLNVTLAIAEARTRTVILHDFDLYPVVPEYFERLHHSLLSRDLRFCGFEKTRFDGLMDEDTIIGTWSLTIDSEWLRRSWRPIQCFHRLSSVHGKRTRLDPFSWIQFQTPARDLADCDGIDFCHVKNLCSTYLRLVSGGPISIAWKLHYLWYLEYVGGRSDRLEHAEELMANARDRIVTVAGRPIDFREVDPLAVTVLEQEVRKMETFLHGTVRDEVAVFLSRSRAFFFGEPAAGTGA